MRKVAAPSAGPAPGIAPKSLYDRQVGRREVKRAAPEDQDAIVHDLEAEEVQPADRTMRNVGGEVKVATISGAVGMANGHVKKSNSVTLNGYGPLGKPSPQRQQNGHIPNGKSNFRNMLEEADNYPIHSYM